MKPNRNQQSLALIALFETEFSIDWIQEISQFKATDILLVVDELLENEQLEKVSPGVYRFIDENTRQDMADRLSAAEAKAGHKAIAELLFREIKGAGEAAVAASSHLMKLSNNEKSCRQLLDAGNIYRKSYRHREALTFFWKIIEDLQKKETEEACHIYLEAVIAYTKIVEVSTDLNNIVPPLKRAIRLTQQFNRPNQEVMLEMLMAKTECYRSFPGKALRHFKRGWSLAGSIDDPRLKHFVLSFTTFFHHQQGQFREVLTTYEENLVDIDCYPKSRFPLLSAQVVAISYGVNGQIERGIGMLDAIFKQCRQLGDDYVGSNVAFHIGQLMIDLGRYGEAVEYLKAANKKASLSCNTFVVAFSQYSLALAYYRLNEMSLSVENLKGFYQLNEKQAENQLFDISVYWNPELLWAMELGQYPRIKLLSLREEVNKAKKSRVVLLEGIAYRFQGLMDEQLGHSFESILKSLIESEKLLAASGHEIQLARTRIEIARLHLSNNDMEKARQLIRKSGALLNSFLQHQVPDALRFLIKDLRLDKNLLEEIMKLGQELVTIRSNRELVREILSTVSRITGAERSALFLLKGEGKQKKMILRAARNLTAEDVAQPDFRSPMSLINQVAAEGKSCFRLTDKPPSTGLMESYKYNSCICVPMILREKVIGVLYVDNRMFASAFKESDVKILNYFSAQAAIALDNTRTHEKNRALIGKLEEEKRYLQAQRDSHHSVDFIGESEPVKQIHAKIRKISATDATVLILGETGVGKELVAEAIQHNSARKEKAFIKVNCTVFPESLITAELFGHEKGAFTGAEQLRIGRFELADGGTLFLDEIGDLPNEVQIRLLRVLQNKEFERIGGQKTLRSDFRLLAATNKDLRQEMEMGRFREDLFYRLNVLSLDIPPLRERKSDIPLLADYFVNRSAMNLGIPAGRISEAGMRRLVDYHWPGNVRELGNIIERSTILSSGSTIQIPEFNSTQMITAESEKLLSLKENERRHILRALELSNGKVYGPGGAAELLDINPNTLVSRIRRLDIKKAVKNS